MKDFVVFLDSSVAQHFLFIDGIDEVTQEDRLRPRIFRVVLIERGNMKNDGGFFEEIEFQLRFWTVKSLI